MQRISGCLTLTPPGEEAEPQQGRGLAGPALYLTTEEWIPLRCWEHFRVVVSFIPAEAERSPVQSWDIIQARLGKSKFI